MAKKERKPRKPRVKKVKEKVVKKTSNINDYDKLFNFTKIFFGKNEKYNNVSNYQKKKHKFIMNRFFSIRYPETAEKFNVNKINPVAVIDLWHIVGNKFTRVPYWFWTKTKKSKKPEHVFEPNDNTINYYLKLHNISKRDLAYGMEFNKESITADLKKIEKNFQLHE